MNNTIDKFKSLNELNSENYFIEFIDNQSQISVIAIHGGGIEGGTTEIAKSLALLGNYNYYSFIGNINEQLDCKENLELHITSSKFDDKKCLNLIKNSQSVISIHGCDEQEELTYIGGKNLNHRFSLIKILKDSGFNVPDIIRSGLEGISNKNICNKNFTKMGVQIEVSEGLRSLIFGKNWKVLNERLKEMEKNQFFVNYITSLHLATQKYLNF